MNKETLAELFATHPVANAFFFTADGQPFFDAELAGSHAQRLRDASILEIKRDDVEGAEPSTFADGLGGTPEPLELHPALAADLAQFQQNEGGADQSGGGGVIVPASNILAGEGNTPPAPGTPAPATPAPATPAPAPVVKSLLEIAKETPEAERTNHQKGLITKERNALAKAAAAIKEGDTK